MGQANSRSKTQKLRLFGDYFAGLPGIYGTYDSATSRSWLVKREVNEAVFLAHLQGKQPYGVFLLQQDRTESVAVDFDDENRQLPADFVVRARHYQMAAFIERSKQKGYHAWLFFQKPGVQAAKARLVMRHILEELEAPSVEIFPKQDALNPSSPYGNFINAPLFGKLVPQGRTVFVDPVTFEPYPDQWSVLESIQRVSETHLDELIEANGWSEELTIPQSTPPSLGEQKGEGIRPLLPPCAVEMFSNGVTQNQRVSCFRLAVHCKRVGLPLDVTVGALKVWSLKNRPLPGKQIMAEDEIVEQVQGAYNGAYKGCGCGSPAVVPFCQPSCVLYQRKVAGDDQQERREPGAGIIAQP